jgi:hypothetical protein
VKHASERLSTDVLARRSRGKRAREICDGKDTLPKSGGTVRFRQRLIHGSFIASRRPKSTPARLHLHHPDETLGSSPKALKAQLLICHFMQPPKPQLRYREHVSRAFIHWQTANAERGHSRRWRQPFMIGALPSDIGLMPGTSDVRLWSATRRRARLKIAIPRLP